METTSSPYISGPYLARELMGVWDVYRDGRRVRQFRTKVEAIAWIDSKAGA